MTNSRVKKSKKKTTRKNRRLRGRKKGKRVRRKQRRARRKHLYAHGQLPLWRPCAAHGLSNRAVVGRAFKFLLAKNKKFKKLLHRRVNTCRFSLFGQVCRFNRRQSSTSPRLTYRPAVQFTYRPIFPRRRLFVRMLQRRGR